MEIRTERSSDYDAVFQLNYLAFGNREVESRLIERIRLSDAFIPVLSLIAEENDRIVGHILFSRAELVDEEKSDEVIALGPIAVLPGHQKSGVGSKLIQEGLKRCAELGYNLVFLIGHPTYYPKFGFKLARPYGINLKQFEVSDDVFMVCELKEGTLSQKIKGEFKFSKSFLV
ncbi:GNAT family N-acetyltransferase [Paenibacillus sp. SI8]|uniref:GNAT family N-acetyltransferase n=1 Tax=unclassified Paenibacillus TaxID=185978 RepID=UPI003465C710